MFDNLWKRRDPAPGTPSVQPGEAGRDSIARIARGNPQRTGSSGTPGVAQISFDLLGATAVCTILDRDLTADRVSDLSLQIRTYLMNHPGVKNLVLDLQNVDYLDSCCLNMLIVLLKMVREGGGRIALASAQRSIAVLFKLTRLDSLFPVHRDVLSAIAHVDAAA
jgi:anti-anti-sigma factor